MSDAPPMRFKAFGTDGPWHDYDPETRSAPCGATIQNAAPMAHPGSTFATVEMDPGPRCTACVEATS